MDKTIEKIIKEKLLTGYDPVTIDVRARCDVKEVNATLKVTIEGKDYTIYGDDIINDASMKVAAEVLATLPRTEVRDALPEEGNTVCPAAEGTFTGNGETTNFPLPIEETAEVTSPFSDDNPPSSPYDSSDEAFLEKFVDFIGANSYEHTGIDEATGKGTFDILDSEGGLMASGTIGDLEKVIASLNEELNS